ncbi:MAG: hypothetical protein ACR2RF_33375 [Geminicoccaceae bacterium]
MIPTRSRIKSRWLSITTIDRSPASTWGQPARHQLLDQQAFAVTDAGHDVAVLLKKARMEIKRQTRADLIQLLVDRVTFFDQLGQVMGGELDALAQLAEPLATNRSQLVEEREISALIEFCVQPVERP